MTDAPYTDHYPLLPPGLYKVRKTLNDPRGLEICEGDYQGHRLALPPQFEMPKGDAMVHIVVVKAQRLEDETPHDFIKDLTNPNPLSGYERMILRSLAIIMRLLITNGRRNQYAPRDVHDAQTTIIDLERGANV